MTDSHRAPLQSIVIVGGGTAGWIAAAMLARFVPAQTRIELVESDAIGTIGVGESTIPQIRLLLAGLDIDEYTMLAATQGTFKLGVELVDWFRPGQRYMHAFGQVGRGLGITPFHHYWLRGRAAGLAAPLHDYSPSAVAAAKGRFARASDAPPLSYAYHLDATLLGQFLRRVAEAAGVVRTEGRVVDAERAANGDIAAIVMDDGRRIEGDLFVDCSGFRSLLLGGALGVEFEDWSTWLPCDRAVAIQCEQPGAILPFTRATARPVGWQWRIGLRHRIGNGLVYASHHLSDDEAASRLLDELDGAPIGTPNQLRFKTGRRRAFWEHNVVAIGLSAGFLEPLEATSIHLVQSGVARLLELFPDREQPDSLRRTYNAQTIAEYENVRDFLILHYHANAREGDFWRYCRDAALPGSLADKIDLFHQSARIVPTLNELFTEPGWLQVMTGQGIVPAGWSSLADGLTPEQLGDFLDRQRRAVEQHVAAMPTHDEYVAGIAQETVSVRV